LEFGIFRQGPQAFGLTTDPCPTPRGVATVDATLLARAAFGAATW
jgi:hypothetical protein